MTELSMCELIRHGYASGYTVPVIAHVCDTSEEVVRTIAHRMGIKHATRFFHLVPPERRHDYPNLRKKLGASDAARMLGAVLESQSKRSLSPLSTQFTGDVRTTLTVR